MSVIRTINLIFLGDLYKFFVDHNNGLVKVERYLADTHGYEVLDYMTEVPECLKEQLIETLYASRTSTT